MNTQQRLMISYSRRQTPFVDHLNEELENDGYSVWLDYHSLVPARPWYQQIEAGIGGADVILLVVSRDSIQSKYVEPEWRLALQYEKRVILLIFEAFLLPPELQGCEWVDFRVNHKQSLKELRQLLESPSSIPVSAPLQRGFKAPTPFWLALVLSVIVLFSSVPTWWTLIVPYILIPLPWQIYKRNYMFSRVVPALLLVPFLYFFSVIIVQPGNILYEVLGEVNRLNIVPVSLTSWSLLALLLTPAMQRRATPEAARVHFANPLIVDKSKPRSVVFAIDYAPEDGRYAEDLRRGLQKHEHRLAQPGEKPEAVFVLLSTYKKDTEHDPDQQAVYPILLQAVGEIAPKLRRIQWIDFRKGIRTIDRLARLLPEPERLLKALAVAPTGSQEIFPLPVNALQYVYIIVGVLGTGSLLMAIVSYARLIFLGQVGTDKIQSLFVATIYGALLFGAVLYSVRGLRSRMGGTAAVYPLLILTVFQGISYVFSFNILTGVVERSAIGWHAAWGSLYTLFALIGGAAIMFLSTLLGWRDLYRWLPRRQAHDVGRLESWLLLYTPLSMRAYIFHLLFHIILLVTFLMIHIVIRPGFSTRHIFSILMIFLMAFLILWGLHWLARRISK